MMVNDTARIALRDNQKPCHATHMREGKGEATPKLLVPQYQV
jgi:hypothetical protein